MNLELEQTKIRLIDTQMALLQYQRKDVQERIAAIETQEKFDAAVDSHDMPSGAIKQADKFIGD
jgi:hypothetical protein